jgi:hypothetical protein
MMRKAKGNRTGRSADERLVNIVHQVLDTQPSFMGIDDHDKVMVVARIGALMERGSVQWESATYPEVATVIKQIWAHAMGVGT